MFGRETILNKIPAAGGCTNTVDLYNPFPDGGGVALYQLNGDATDESTNYNGTWSGTEAYTTGVFGQAATISGGAYIDTSLTYNSDELTVSVWVYSTGTADQLRPLNTGNTASNLGYQVRIDPNGDILWWLFGNNSSGGLVTASSAFTLNQWNHIVGTYNQTTGDIKLYVNGEFKAGKTNIQTSTPSTYPLRIGNQVGTSDTQPYSIDQVRIFSRALRPYEVEALYTEEYCTPTIVPSEHFNTVLYTGDGTSSNAITGVGFKPDLVWLKDRSAAAGHWLNDSVRGAGKGIMTQATSAEITSLPELMSSFDSDGFTVGYISNNTTNFLNNPYVSWNFKAGGAAVTNTDGTITSQVSANTEAGFSVVTYGGTGAAGTVGHGLSSAPELIIIKTRDVSADWLVMNSNIGLGGYLDLNLALTSARYNDWSNNTNPSDSVVSLGGYPYTTGSSMLMYAFHSVEGFSNFGSYVGTNAPNNNIVTGFEPAMIIIKSTGATNGDWNIFDNKRNPSNPLTDVLKANTSGAEATEAALNISFLENGFSLNGAASSGGTGQINQSGITYIYMAFAADPTTIEPSLEDSFNTVLYSGNGSATQQVTGVGFQPDFTWIKDRINSGTSHFLQDSVRGFSGASPNWAYSLLSDETISESTTGQSWRDNQGGVSSFDSDGFSVWTGASPSNSAFNKPAANYVAWNWKGAEIPAINSNGSIPSVVSANPAAGFSIVSYSGNSDASATIGHGLGIQPKFVVVKRLQGGYNWMVGYLDGGVQHSLYLNTTAARDNELNRSPIAFTENTFKPSTIVGDHTNGTGSTYIAYCFAEVAGFSKFGSYTGGSTGSGNVINTGFKPMFVMVKRTDISGDAWQMFDSVRGGGDTFDNYVQANDSAAEVSYNQREINLTANGFYWTYAESGTNISGGTYIYMAFANQF